MLPKIELTAEQEESIVSASIKDSLGYVEDRETELAMLITLQYYLNAEDYREFLKEREKNDE